MPYYLTIDIGNTSAKAALWHGNELAAPAIWGRLKPLDITRLCAQAQGEVACAALCSVAGDLYGLDDAAAAASAKYMRLDAATPVPISLEMYGTVGTLGTDRIAALCGAQSLHLGSELLVVDYGTAVTYDRLSADGRFLGGNIAPGIGMRLRAMHEFTAKLPEVATDIDAPLWGLTTAQAMQAGAMRGVIAETLYYHGQAPEGTRLIVTGGRSPLIASHLPIECTVDPDLVLRGLKNIIDYNENK